MTTINNEPVTKKELWGILMDFFEQVIAPYLDLRFGKIEKKHEEHDERFDKLDDRLDRHSKQSDNHETRITKLETPLA